MKLDNYQVWFVTGSQHLYGEEALKAVGENAEKIARAFHEASTIPVAVIFKPVLTKPEAIRQLCQDASADPNCIGLICWMHTFSPGKMWIAGLKVLNKPLLHLHTQFARDIPWAELDMDYMNLHQSAHGGREFGHICTRLNIRRKVVVGHWQEKSVMKRVGIWSRVAAAWQDSQYLRVARIGDNMRGVAVTEGDKVAAQICFGYSVDGYGLGDLTEHIRSISNTQIESLLGEYHEQYAVVASLQPGGAQADGLRNAAKIELGLRSFLEAGGFHAFTDTFENLHGLEQLPGIAVQRLMADGYGFGAEGDWKTAALVRAMKVMGAGLDGGQSFMEDYTYHFHPDGMQVLGSHMLEICPSIAGGQPSCEIHPLGIGGKSDPVRLVFNVAPGPGLNASIIDVGHRFRLLVNTVETLVPENDLPRLPVARVLWQPQPDLPTAAAAWILAGGSHHTCFSQSLTTEYLEDFAEMAGVELVLIDEKTEMRKLKQELRWGEGGYDK